MIIWQNSNNKLMKLACWRCACYLLQYAGKNILIDTSVKFERSKLITSLHSFGITELHAIIITHNHFDHVANAAYCQKIFNCPIYIASESIPNLQKGICILPNGNNFFTKCLYWLAQKTIIKQISSVEACANVYDIAEFISSEPSAKLRMLRTVGHSADSISIIVENQVALVGDAFIRLSFMKNVFLPWVDDKGQILPSWKKLLATNCFLFCQSHGSPTSKDILEQTVKKYNFKAKSIK